MQRRVSVVGWLLCFLWMGSALANSPTSAPVASSKTPIACVISPDAPAGPLEIRVESRSGSRIADSQSAPEKIVWIDTQSRVDGDWMQIEADGVKGWVEEKWLVCRASPEQAREIISTRALHAVEWLKQRNLRELSRLAHPVKGVRFSPYAFLNKKANVSFTAATLPGAWQKTKPRVWGNYEGSGAPIRLTFADYYQHFIYDRDFAAATEISYNSGPIAQGNTHDNAFEEYPNAIIVEYHLPGVEPEQEGMDWASLRLIFERHQGAWYLVYVVHDQWSV